MTTVQEAVKTAVSRVSTAVLTAESFIQLMESSVQLMDPRPKLCSIEIDYVQLKRRPARDNKKRELFFEGNPLAPPDLNVEKHN